MAAQGKHERIARRSSRTEWYAEGSRPAACPQAVQPEVESGRPGPALTCGVSRSGRLMGRPGLRRSMSEPPDARANQSVSNVTRHLVQ